MDSGLGLTFEELGAVVAGYSPTGPISEVINAIRATLIQLFAPTTESLPILKNVFGGAENAVALLHERLRRDGLLKTLEFLRSEVGEDTVSFRKLLGSVEAVSFVIDATGNNMGKYTAALEANRNALGSVNEGLEIFKTTGAFQAQIATNNLRLALDSFYNNAVVPLLKAFGELPSLIQTVALGLTTLSVASLALGGPSIGILVRSLGRFIWSLKTGTIWSSTFAIRLGLAGLAVQNFARRLGMASLAVLRFALKAIVAGISGVIAFGVALWASMIPPLIAATAAVTAFTVALLANPVVLVIAAVIGAFVALGFVVYRFRAQIVGALKSALAWVKDNWPLLVGILFGPFGIAAALIFKFRGDVVDAVMWVKDRVTAIFTALRDFVIGIWDGLAEGLAGAFRGVINGVIDGLNKALEVAASLVGAIKGALDKIPGPNPAGDFLLDVASKLRAGIPNFAIGGIVPGPTGRPMLATVHGGEMIIPPSVGQMLLDMFQGFKLGAAGLPTPPPGAGTMYRQSINNRPTVNMGDITINITTSPGADSTEIAEDVAQNIADAVDKAIGKTFRDIAHDFDGPIER